MSDSDGGNDPPTPDQTTPEQTIPEQQHEAVMAFLKEIRQEANEASTTLRQWMNMITQQIDMGFHVRVYPHFDENRPGALEHRWDMSMSDMPPEVQTRFYSYMGSRIAAANLDTTQRAGGEGAPDPPQVVNQDRSGDSDNAELQRLRQSELEQKKRIEELEDALKRSQTHQTQTTTPQPNNIARGSNAAQNPNESDVAESSSAAQRRAQQRNAAPEQSATSAANMAKDEEMARRIQEQIWAEGSPDEDISRAELDGIVATGGSLNDRSSDEDDLYTQQSKDQPSEEKRKRNKGKGRVTDAKTKDESSQSVPAKPQTPSAADLSLDDDAPLDDSERPNTEPQNTEPPDAEPSDAEPPGSGIAATHSGQIRRKSVRQIVFKAAEEEKRKIKPEKLDKPRSRPWLDPRTGKPVKGYHMADNDCDEEKPCQPDSKPRKRTTEDAQRPATKRHQSRAEAEAEQATDILETQDSMGPEQDNSGNDDIQNREVSQQLKRPSEIDETEAADALSEAFASENDNPDSVIPDDYFEESFVDDTDPATMDENEDQDEEAEEEEDDDNFEDGCEATTPDEAHVFSNRPKRIIKPGNSRQSTIGVGRRHGESATSWVENPAKDGEDRPAKPSKKRKSTSPTPAEDSDDEDTARSPEKKQKPSKAKPNPATKKTNEQAEAAAGNGGKQNKDNFPPFNVRRSLHKKTK